MNKLILTLALCAATYKGLPALIASTSVAKTITAHNEQLVLAAKR